MEGGDHHHQHSEDDDTTPYPHLPLHSCTPPPQQQRHRQQQLRQHQRQRGRQHPHPHHHTQPIHCVQASDTREVQIGQGVQPDMRLHLPPVEHTEGGGDQPRQQGTAPPQGVAVVVEGGGEQLPEGQLSRGGQRYDEGEGEEDKEVPVGGRKACDGGWWRGQW